MPAFHPALQYYKWQNTLHTLLLLAGMLALTSLLGWMLWGGVGVAGLMIFVFTLFLLMPRIPGVWLMRMYRARQLTPQTAPGLYNIVQELALRAGLPAIPQLYLIPSQVINAFATGHTSQPVIALTEGMLHNLEPEEVIAVLAHETSHVRNNDLLVMGLADLFSRLTSILSLVGQLTLIITLPLILANDKLSIPWLAVMLLIISPNLSALAQLGLSRTREYEADRGAVELTGDSRALASALLKLERWQGGMWERILLPGRKLPEPSLLRTHPPTEERVQRLLAMDSRPQQPFRISRLPPYMLGGLGMLPPAPRWRIHGLWY